MNWVRHNRFLAGFLAFVLLGAGGLTFLLVTTLGRYQQIDADYKTQVTELQRLQALEPFPDAASQKKYELVRKEYTAAVTALQKNLADHNPKPANPPPSPIQFQDRLRQVVGDVSTLAQNTGVGLPEGFYLGFEQYRGSPPDAAATPSARHPARRDFQSGDDPDQDAHRQAFPPSSARLSRRRAVAMLSLRQRSRRHRAGPGAAAMSAGGALVTKQSMEIAFTSLPSSLLESLNNITRDKGLYLIRALQVKNEVDKGPARDWKPRRPCPAAPVPAPTDATPAPTAPGPTACPNPAAARERPAAALRRRPGTYRRARAHRTAHDPAARPPGPLTFPARRHATSEFSSPSVPSPHLSSRHDLGKAKLRPFPAGRVRGGVARLRRPDLQSTSAATTRFSPSSRAP